MPKQLTTQNVTITTATIEVKALTIGARQVTQSVFRQLREEPLIAQDGTLNGVPWGAVNYHPDKCGDSNREHWHIVWQRGTELLRARVDEKASFDRWQSPDSHSPEGTPVFWPDSAGAYVEMLVREWLHGRVDQVPLARRREPFTSYSDERMVKFGTLTVGADVGRLAVKAADARDALDRAKARSAKDPEDAYGWYGKALKEAQTEADAALAELDEQIDTWNTTLAELKAGLDEEVSSEKARRQRHRDARTTLGQLPQLFIAV